MMKKFWKQKIFWLAVVLLAVVGTAQMQGVVAYFTTYVTAKGGYPITLGTKVTIHEEVEDMAKHIVLSNTGESDCYVRVKVFCGSQVSISFSSAVDENSEPYWNVDERNEYWYYKEIVPVGADTKELIVKMEVPKEWKDSFNVVVIQECTPVLYREDGTPYADWSKKVDTRTDIGTVMKKGEGGE